MSANSSAKVLVFSTPTCSYCTIAKRYLKEKNIRFKEIDISKNASAATDIQKRTGQAGVGVPVLLINNRPIVGFDKTKINKMLGLI